MTPNEERAYKDGMFFAWRELQKCFTLKSATELAQKMSSQINFAKTVNDAAKCKGMMSILKGFLYLDVDI